MIISLTALTDTNEAPAEPFALFLNWLEAAEAQDRLYPNAMCLATVDQNNHPQTRTVLLKGIDDRGFIFYTNTQSRKGEELRHNPHASLCFYWKTLQRQVRVNGQTEPVSEKEADAYFATRPRGSQIGAWASEQSRPLDDRKTLERRIKELEERYGKDTRIPRPPHWSGYRLEPSRIEFWEEGDFRLHTRLVYNRQNNSWKRKFLNP